ncbi:hypothetical protein CGCTS75_v007262 [Colletotrichum tropicale]|nr:hypothetical protein CGCTS75_v007262 [Colletotrichum tropicale]
MYLSAFSSLCLGTLIVLGSPIVQRRDTDLNSTRCPDFCANTETTTDSDPALYICGDKRLGPVTLPSGIPLEGIAGMGSTYRRFGGLCPGEFLAKYWNTTSKWFDYPKHEGYSLDTAGEVAKFNLTLKRGDFIDRFGSENGTYVAPAGTPYALRSLPPVNLNAKPEAKYPYNYYVYMVMRNMVVEGGPIAPWFGQQGLGIQFLMPDHKQLWQLVEEGYLARIDLKTDPYW